MTALDEFLLEPREDRLANLAPVIPALLRKPFLTEETEPELFRAARAREDDLRQWFHATLGWRVRISNLGRYVRLFKRRHQPPQDRSCLPREGAGKVSVLVLTLLCLIAEQLWRRPEITFGDLQREVIRTCAAESGAGRLPAFQVVTQAGEPRAKAEQHRRAFVDACELLREWGFITSDGPLTAAGTDAGNDIVITCNPERLNDLLAAPAISQLQIDLSQPHTHVAKLCEDQAALPDHASENQRDLQRRHRALRAVIDDAVVPLGGDGIEATYLASPGGRRQAVQAAMVAGLTCVVRRDLWLTADSGRRSTDLDFPQPHSIPGQAALLIVQWLNTGGAPQPLTEDACQAVIAEAKADQPEWAKSFRSNAALQTLTQEALASLVAAGILIRTSDRPPAWTTTGAHGHWRVRVATPDRRGELPLTDDALFDQDGKHEQVH
ncbi:DUF2398 family protein [Micromonospora saelicesensis]|uniref:TIGR02678 family protein n=1 Tax=Micromonospora saelicesensis TaxID=285676 RepID=A0A1C4Z3J5_9ACTN|nr:DUF2398 family protein [Micromonospora saelicesensis]SCF27181.1 TIGR02678 family protein [Micromonospora saelicesensis]